MEAYLRITDKKETKALDQELTSIKDIHDAIKASWENVTDEYFWLVFKENNKITLRLSLPQETRYLKNKH